MIDDLLQLYATNLDRARVLVGDIDAERMTLQPVEGINHPAWILGHLTWVSADVLGRMILGVDHDLPADYESLFNHRSTPVADPTLYGSRESLVDRLEDSHAGVFERLSKADESFIQQPTPHPRLAARFETIGKAMVHMMVGHEQYHLGQLSSWRRTAGLPRV